MKLPKRNFGVIQSATISENGTMRIDSGIYATNKSISFLHSNKGFYLLNFIFGFLHLRRADLSQVFRNEKAAGFASFNSRKPDFYN